MTYQLTDAQKTLVRRAHDFAEEFLEPSAAELDRGLVFPKAVIGQLAAGGFLGLLAPKNSEVAVSGFADHIEVVQALSRSCAAIASIINHHAMFSYGIATWGSDQQKQDYLPLLAKGEKLATFAIQEDGPVPGTGPGAVSAVREGDGFVLNGMKAFVRNAGAADLYLVFATIAPESGGNGLTAFIVEAAAAGLTVGPRLPTMGLKACPVAHLIFKNVRVSDAGVMGSANCGGVIATQILAVAAVAEAAQTVGIAKAAVVHAADYAKQRVQFRHPIAALQAIQTLLADIATDSHMAWLGVRHAAGLIDGNGPFGPEAAMVKAFAGRIGTKILVDAIQVEGGMGISEVVPKHITLSLPLARMFRDIAGTTLLDAPDDFPEKLIAACIA